MLPYSKIRIFPLSNGIYFIVIIKKTPVHDDEKSPIGYPITNLKVAHAYGQYKVVCILLVVSLPQIHIIRQTVLVCVITMTDWSHSRDYLLYFLLHNMRLHKFYVRYPYLHMYILKEVKSQMF